MVPSTVVMPREGSFALASFGRVRKVQEPTFAVAAGRKSFALKRILETVLVIFAWYHWLQAEALSAVMAARESI
jgi:hypothetical protein